MGFWRGVGSLLGLVDNNQTASELAKDLSSGIDMIVYTSEEKAINNFKMTTMATEAWLRMVELMKGSEQYRSRTRRFITVWVIFNLFSMIWICILTEIAATFGWFGDTLVRIYDPSVLANSITTAITLTPLTWTILKIAGVFNLGWVFCTIIIFYFGPQLAQILTSGKKK